MNKSVYSKKSKISENKLTKNILNPKSLLRKYYV